MTLAELLPEIQTLPRADKLELLQVLAADIAREEQMMAGWKGSQVEIWSPYDAHDAAQKLSDMLAAAKRAEA